MALNATRMPRESTPPLGRGYGMGCLKERLGFVMAARSWGASSAKRRKSGRNAAFRHPTSLTSLKEVLMDWLCPLISTRRARSLGSTGMGYLITKVSSNNGRIFFKKKVSPTASIAAAQMCAVGDFVFQVLLAACIPENPCISDWRLLPIFQQTTTRLAGYIVIDRVPERTLYLGAKILPGRPMPLDWARVMRSQVWAAWINLELLSCSFAQRSSQACVK